MIAAALFGAFVCCMLGTIAPVLFVAFLGWTYQRDTRRVEAALAAARDAAPGPIDWTDDDCDEDEDDAS